MNTRVRFAACLLLSLPLPAFAAEADDREHGEGDRLERRQEWFFSTRRAGTRSPADLAARRAAAAEETLLALAAQRGKRGVLPLWTAKGPTPSTFGNWAFGRVAGRIGALARGSDGALYAGSASGGLWRTTNGGVTWTHLFERAPTQTVGAVAVDPNDPGVLWAGTGDYNAGCETYFGVGLLRSTDGGNTWERRNGIPGADLEDVAMISDVVVDPRDSAHVVVGGRRRGCLDGTSSAGGIYVSQDAGATWTKRLADEFVHAVVQSPVEADVWWASSSRGVFRSTDNAASWTLQTASGLPSGSTGRTEVAIAPSDDSVVYALFQTGLSGSPEVWRTGDRGLTWTRRSLGSAACDGQCSYNMTLKVKVDDPAVVYRGTIHLFKSADSGASWTDLSGNWGPTQKVHQDTHALLLDPTDPSSVWVGCDGGLWQTKDGGVSFDNRNGNLNVTQFYTVGVDRNNTERICGGSQDNGSLARIGSNVWSLQAATGDGFSCAFNPVSTSFVYASSYPNVYPQIYRSTNGLFGNYFVVTGSGSGIAANDRINWVTPFVLDPVNPNTAYLGTHKLYTSTNSGASWTRVGPLDFTWGSGVVLAIDVHPSTTDVVAVGTNDGRVWRSSSGGTFTVLEPGLPSRAVNDVALDPEDPGRVLAVLGGFGTAHLWEWTPSTGWGELGAGLPDVPANTVVMRDAREIYVGVDTGIFRSRDGGLTFEPFMEGLPAGLVVTDLKLEGDVLTAGTYGRGAWQTTLPPPPGAGPGGVSGLVLERQSNGEIQASWPAACNDAAVPGQTYSIQAGTLAALRGGIYDHRPVGDRCDRLSPDMITPVEEDAYYLVVPNEGGREGSAGFDSASVPRPQVATVCGPRQVGSCP